MEESFKKLIKKSKKTKVEKWMESSFKKLIKKSKKKNGTENIKVSDIYDSQMKIRTLDEEIRRM